MKFLCGSSPEHHSPYAFYNSIPRTIIKDLSGDSTADISAGDIKSWLEKHGKYVSTNQSERILQQMV